ncbi:MAG: transcriptional repressor [Candidatus Omnitrophota bacterium]
MKKIDIHQAMSFFEDKCRSYGLRITPQRTLIYKELLKATDHPSVDTVMVKVRKVMPNVSFDTVYRTVLSFAKIGIVNMVGGYGGARRFDPNIGEHHHFRCTKCDRIIDFYSPSFDALKIPEDVKRKFNVLNKKVLLEGICEKCDKKK